MEFSFFTTDNKSGYKTNQKWLLKNHPEELTKILSFCKGKISDTSSIKEKIWVYYHNLPTRPKCVGCGKEVIFSERFDRGYNEFCSVECINSNKEEMTLRVRKTMNEKYGVDYYPEHKDFITKQKQTKKLKYGNENYNNMDKNFNTKKLLYGDKNYVNIKKAEETSIKKYGVKNYSLSEEYKTQIDSDYKKIYPKLDIVSIQHREVTIKCKECGGISTISKQMIYERNKTNTNPCTICHPFGQSMISSGEQQMIDFIESLGVAVIPSHKILPNKKEIDVFLPNHNIGFEYNGLYWHNELFMDQKYHLNKTNDAKNLGIDLIHIFEDEWVNNRPIVESIIKNKLNKIGDKIFGRKCVIEEVLSKEASIFLEKNHIQGNVNSKIRLGLYYNEELVSLMTFNRGRALMGGKLDEWELSRFCNKINTNVIGAASKLFEYFKKHYDPKKIVSYSDIRLFDGKMYEKLGFERIHESEPNYWYVINGLRYYRFGFRKSNLIKEGFDPNKTEQQIMLDRKIYRIYDCGNVRWEYNIS